MMIKVPENPKNYTMIHNEVAKRTDLSARAKGIYYYIATLPPDWKLHVQELESHFTEGRTAINTALKELIRAGYIVRQQQRNEKGVIIGTTYIGNWTVDNIDNQLTEKPFVDSPCVDNLQLLNTKKQTNEEKSKQKNKNKTILSNCPESDSYYSAEKEEIIKEFLKQGLNNKKHKTDRREFDIIGESRHDEYKFGF